MAKRKTKRKKMRSGIKRRPWTTADDRTLRAYSKAFTPVSKIAKEMKRTPGALRQHALILNIGLGHTGLRYV